MTRQVDPHIEKTAFSCPHCGAYTTQTWYNVFAESIEGDSRVPRRVGLAALTSIENAKDVDNGTRADILAYVKRCLDGDVFLDDKPRDAYPDRSVVNASICSCYNCYELSFWVFDKLIYPNVKLEGAPPNPDLDKDIQRDYNEARGIVAVSPRGAAALLRLCVQKLCVQLGKPGKNIDADIAALVADGLNVKIKQALDIVRVVGNESVHPGTMNMADDHATVSQLFALVNVIADQMITQPNAVEELYGALPKEKRDRIEARDAMAIASREGGENS